MTTKLLVSTFMLALLACQPALAEQAAIDGGKVFINDIRGPALKRYRAMVAGLDAFDEHHGLAPAAPEVRFRLRALLGDPDVDLNQLGLRIAGDTLSIPLPLASDHSFTLPRSAAAAKEDADVLLNKKAGKYRWQVLVRSSALPEGVDRLGDLRLECQVAAAIGKRELNFMQRAFTATVMGTADWCSSKKMDWVKISPRLISSATLLAADGRITLEVSEDRRSYTAPTSDKRYPDEALIELRYVDAS